MRYFFTLLLVNALLFNTPVCGQSDSIQVKVSKDKVKLSGKLYYIHTVRTGETLYNIAKAYQVAQTAIVESNPELYQGIKAGSTLKVPVVQELKNPNANRGVFHIVKKGETLYGISKLYSIPTETLSKINLLSDSNIQENQNLFITSDESKASKLQKMAEAKATINQAKVVPAKLSKAIVHDVIPKETLTSIAKKYGITIDELVAGNPILKSEGLKTGQQLTIASPKQVSVDEPATSVAEKNVTTTDCQNYTYKPGTVFNVVLILPLGGETAVIDTSSKSSSARRYEDIMQYYEGTLIAIDSLKNSGVSVKLTVIDTKTDKDLDAITKALKTPVLKEANLIIGPVYSEAIPMVAKFAESHKIPMVSPLATAESVVRDNRYFVQVANDATALTRLSVEYARRDDGKTTLVIPSDGSDAKLVKEFKAALKEKLPELSYRQGNNAVSQREALKAKLVQGKNNRFVVLSNNEVFVLDFLQNLTNASKGYDVEVLGRQKWLKFTSVDMAYIHGANVQMYVQNYADYSAETTKSFVRSFRNFYKAEPNNYAFRGFDVAYYFINALKKNGPDFIGCLPKLSSQNIHTPFRFVKVGENGGYINTDAALIKHGEGFRVERVK